MDWLQHMNAQHRPPDDEFQLTSEAFEGRILELTHFYFRAGLDHALGKYRYGKIIYYNIYIL